MATLIASAAVPGTLYVDGRPVGTLGNPLRVPLQREGAYLLFAPHADGYLPIAREMQLGDTVEGVGGLRALLWPGGTLEVFFSPMRCDLPVVVETAPFLDSVAMLKRSDRVFVDIEDRRLPVGEGPDCGLRTLPDGSIAAFAQEGDGEALRIISPRATGPETALLVSGKQVLLSPDGDRVRVHEFTPPGALHSAVREYQRQGNRYVPQKPSITALSQGASTGAGIARAFTAAIQMGALDEALAMLTPSLRAVVDAHTLEAFFGEFDGYTDARHATPSPGIELLALLRPIGNAHAARLMAFEIVSTDLGPRIENVKAWQP